MEDLDPEIVNTVMKLVYVDTIPVFAIDGKTQYARSVVMRYTVRPYATDDVSIKLRRAEILGLISSQPLFKNKVKVGTTYTLGRNVEFDSLISSMFAL